MVKAFAIGKPAVALKLHTKYFPLFKDLFIESNPVPAKAALEMMGVIEGGVRLPLVSLSAKSKQVLTATMKACGVIK